MTKSGDDALAFLLSSPFSFLLSRLLSSHSFMLKRTLSRSRVMYACASASGEPRVPILTVFVATAAATTIEAPRRATGARRGATAAAGRALAEDAIDRLLRWLL